MPRTPRSFAAFAQAAPGLNGLVADELRRMGLAVASEGKDGVEFETDYAGIYRANLGLRTASRVLVRVARFQAAHFNQLEKGARTVDWDAFREPGRPIEFRVSTTKSRLYHKRAIEERLSRIVPGALMEPEQSSADAHLVVVRMFRDQCTLSVDTSGDLLHRRGYRQDVGKAPLRETLAAAVVLGSGWTGDRPLTDGFCGSGTIAIEAAMIAKRIAPGVGRSFAIEAWPDFPQAVIESERAAWKARAPGQSPEKIWASDRDAGAVARTIANAERAGVRDLIEVHRASVSELTGGGEGGFWLSNPPYGVRVQGARDLRDLYDRWGAVLRSSFSGTRCGILAAGPDLVRRLGIHFDVTFRTTNGGLPVALFSGQVP